MDFSLVLYILKLCLGGIAAFTAILLTTRSREEVWVLFSCAIVIKYIETTVNMLVSLNVILPLESYGMFGNVLLLLLSSLPDLLFIMGIILKLVKSL